LVHNCQLPGIVKFNAALSDRGENIVMQEIAPGNRGMNKTVAVNESSSGVTQDIIPAMALDSLEYFDLKLIQLDLEGNEIKAIDGALETIKKHKPMIILECGNNYEEENIEYHARVIDKMKSIGYKNVKQLNILDVVFLPN
jgi:FkbM family methyltransferase